MIRGEGEEVAEADTIDTQSEGKGVPGMPKRNGRRARKPYKGLDRRLFPQDFGDLDAADWDQITPYLAFKAREFLKKGLKRVPSHHGSPERLPVADTVAVAARHPDRYSHGNRDSIGDGHRHALRKRDGRRGGTVRRRQPCRTGDDQTSAESRALMKRKSSR
jgi:hypothetical protein